MLWGINCKCKHFYDYGFKTNYNQNVQHSALVKIAKTPHSTSNLPFNNVPVCACAVVPESLSLKNPGQSYLKVSPGGSRIRQADRTTGLYKDFNPGTVSEENFQTGQHYWEIEVREKPDWTVGVKMGVAKSAESEILLHLKHSKGYVLSCDGKNTTLNTRDKPQKIGLYLDCERKQVSFYNADNMSRLAQISYSSKQPCCLTLVPGLYLDGMNSDPLTVCSYEFSTGKH